MANNTVRVIIPRNAEDSLKLANLIYGKHQADGKDSPLNTLKDYNWDEIGPEVQIALKEHNKAEELSRLAEEAYRERDKHMVNVDAVIKASRDLLLPINRKNPKVLGEYGFVVNDTPRDKNGGDEAAEK